MFSATLRTQKGAACLSTSWPSSEGNMNVAPLHSTLRVPPLCRLLHLPPLPYCTCRLCTRRVR
eukprot:6064300-Pleurochrysis_carterae.AAC.7